MCHLLEDIGLQELELGLCDYWEECEFVVNLIDFEGVVFEFMYGGEGDLISISF